MKKRKSANDDWDDLEEQLETGQLSDDAGDDDFDSNIRGGLGSKSASLKKAPAAHAVASWEKHTTGIGSKLLKKSGWKPGEGLGRDKSGIVAPVEVKLRPKGMGIAYKGFEESIGVDKQKEPAGNKEGSREKRNAWKASPLAQAPKKKRVQYKTVDEIMLDQISASVAAPESKLEASKPERTYFTELVHNVTLMVSRSQTLLETVSSDIRHESAELRRLALQIERLNSAISGESQGAARLKGAIQIVRDIQAASKEAAASNAHDPFAGADFQKFEVLYSLLTTDYRQAFLDHNLSTAVVSILVPIVQKGYRNWRIFTDPKRGLNAFRKWKKLLFNGFEDDRTVSPFHNMIYLYWFPPVRTAISNEWDAKDPFELVDFLNLWNKFLPEFLVQNIMQQLVLPRLEQLVEDWNPKKNWDMPVHAWIQPWLSLLSDSGSGLLKSVRSKLTLVLQNWDPLSDTAHLLLAPWMSVLEPGDFTHIINKLVLPKLSVMLQNDMVINPRNQSFDVFNAYVRWHDVVHLSLLVPPLDTWFFHRWLHVLYRWLSVSDTNGAVFKQISDWYSEWKEKFPTKLAQYSGVSLKFTLALNMMNFAMEKGSVEGFADGVYASPTPPQRPAQEQPMSKPATPRLSTSTPTQRVTFKDTIEYFASKHNVLFMPTGKTHSSGKQIFKFGKTTIYLNGNVVYAEQAGGGDLFLPISLESLLQHQ